MDIFFIGSLYSPADEKRVLKKSKTGLQGSANNYQWGIIDGLYKNTGEKITVINSVPMGPFPRYCKIFIEKKQKYECESAEIFSGGYINLPLIKQLQRKRYVYKRLKGLLKSSDNPTVIVYSLYNPYLKALKKLKRKGYKFCYNLIITELPGTFGVRYRQRLIGRINERIGEQNLKLSEYADGYVILAEKIKEALNISNKPYTVVEGIIRNDINDLPSINNKSDSPYILYTGALDRQFGIDNLVEAFNLLPKGSARLLIAGSGAYEKELLVECDKNEGICYLGYLGRKKIVRLQSEAAVLVNPRLPENNYTAYSFPSKTMEYLLSGTPVVMYALSGIPEEYLKHLFIPEDSSVKALAKTLSDILNADSEELNRHCEDARRFILEEKNCIVQTKKIIDLINLTNS